MNDNEKDIYTPNDANIGTVCHAEGFSPQNLPTKTLAFYITPENIDDFVLQLLAMKKLAIEKNIEKISIRVHTQNPTKKGYPINIRT